MIKKATQFDRHVEAVLAAVDLLDCFLDRPKISVKEWVELNNWEIELRRHLRMIESRKNMLSNGIIKDMGSIDQKIIPLASGGKLENKESIRFSSVK